MKKRLLMLMLASTLVFSTCAVTGCGEKEATEEGKDADDKDKEDKDEDKEDKDDEDKDEESSKKDDKEEKAEEKEEKAEEKEETATSDYTLEDYLVETNQLDDMIDSIAADGEFEIDGNDMYFESTLDDAGMTDEQFDAAVEQMNAQLGDDFLESIFEDIFDQAHEESGISDPFSITFTMYGEESGKLIWTSTYTN